MSKFMKTTVAAVFTAGLITAPAAMAQSAASTGATDNAAAQKESYKVRQEQGANSGSGQSMTSPAPASSSGATSNAAAQQENYSVRQEQTSGAKSSEPMGGTGSKDGAPVPGTNTRN